MKILVIGSDGFIGKRVVQVLTNEHEIIAANRRPRNGEEHVDLLDQESVFELLKKTNPEIVINCAGVVENSDAAKHNITFTKNLLEQIKKTGLKPQKIITSGSAAAYGVVSPEDIPVAEDTPLNANSGYGLSKLEEEKLALALGDEYGLNVVVARIFNPIGSGMHPRFLIPRIIAQLEEISSGTRQFIEVSRLDSKRDYIDVLDIASAIKCIAEGTLTNKVYNIGSGVSTSNEELISLVVKHSKVSGMPKMNETSSEPEPLVAIQADINRISTELNWQPRSNVENVIKEIMNVQQ